MIGEEVRRRREGLGLTGAQLAARAGMAPSAVSQIETGKRTPSSASVMKLATALGVEVGALYPKGQAPLFPELPEQGPSEQRREHPAWMADAFAGFIDHLEEEVVREEGLSSALTGERRSSALALSRAASGRTLVRSCRWAANAIEGTHTEVDFETAGVERRAVMNRLNELAERADTISQRAIRIHEKLAVAEEREIYQSQEHQVQDSA